MEKDMDEAVRWYQIAANRGNVLAMGRLAWLYSTGTGVPQDAAFAFQYFQGRSGRQRSVHDEHRHPVRTRRRHAA
ncbi:MAG: tetratricopeptide repeat protein [Butyricicoccaceae bacterium]